MSARTPRTRIPGEFAERATVELTAVLKDAALAVIPVSVLNSCTLRLYDEKSGTIINSRDGVSVLNTNGGTITEQGALTMRLDDADMVIVDGTKPSEMHIALFEWTWTQASVQRTGKAEIAFVVKNLDKVPAS